LRHYVTLSHWSMGVACGHEIEDLAHLIYPEKALFFVGRI